MGNLLCCQSPQNTTQFRIEQIIAEDKLYYSNPSDNKVKQRPTLPRIRSKFQFNNNGEMRKIKKIQSRIKAAFARKKFSSLVTLFTSMLKSELKVNIVDNFESIIKKHPGEVLSKSVENKIGKFIIPSNPKYKYTIQYKPVYINKLKNDDIYYGSWNLSKTFQGYGIVYKADGSKFEGMWYNSKLNGLGRYYTNNNEYYIGNFIDGVANGQGLFSHNDGTVYTGEWNNDQPNGEGEEIYIDGSRFKGHYINGKKKYGKFQWEDGSYYEGGIDNDKFQGKGVYFWKEGRTYDGEWNQGQMNGFGLFTYLDGSFYEGEFHNGLRNGQGKYVWNETKSYIGGWMNGKQHGKGKYIKGGKTIEGVWINGKLKTVNSNTNSNSTSLNHNLSDYTATYTCENNETQLAKTNNIKSSI